MKFGYEKRMAQLEARTLPPEVIVVERLIVGKDGVVDAIYRHEPDGSLIPLAESSSGTKVGDCLPSRLARDRRPQLVIATGVPPRNSEADTVSVEKDEKS